MHKLRILIGVGLLAVSMGNGAQAQPCPSGEAEVSTASTTQTLQGRLIYHDALRQWFELKLDRPQCGEASIQLIADGGTHTSMEILRGCRVTSAGNIDFSPTTYYSLNLFQKVDSIQAVGTCARQRPFPDYSQVHPDPSIQEYRVRMHIASVDQPIVFRITSQGKALQPRQAYANYLLTGGAILYGYCAKGFSITHIVGPPEIQPWHFDASDPETDAAAFDVEEIDDAGKAPFDVSYRCVRTKK